MSFSDFFKSKKAEPRAQKGEAPSHWIKCPNCNALMYYKEVFDLTLSNAQIEKILNPTAQAGALE